MGYERICNHLPFVQDTLAKNLWGVVSYHNCKLSLAIEVSE